MKNSRVKLYRGTQLCRTCYITELDYLNWIALRKIHRNTIIINLTKHSLSTDFHHKFELGRALFSLA